MKEKNHKVKYTLLAATTIDGKIARNHSHMSDWTSAEDKVFLRSQLDQSDVVIAGKNTYEVAKEPLSKRNCIVFTCSVQGLYQEKPGLLYLNPEKISLRSVLQEKGYYRVAVLGGMETYNYFLEQDLIDVLHLTIEPLVFGDGLSLFSAVQKNNIRFALDGIEELNEKGSVLLTYKRI